MKQSTYLDKWKCKSWKINKWITDGNNELETINLK